MEIRPIPYLLNSPPAPDLMCGEQTGHPQAAPRMSCPDSQTVNSNESLCHLRAASEVYQPGQATQPNPGDDHARFGNDRDRRRQSDFDATKRAVPCRYDELNPYAADVVQRGARARVGDREDL